MTDTDDRARDRRRVRLLLATETLRRRLSFRQRRHRFSPGHRGACASLPADAVPNPVTVPHETASVAMAHGYYLVTGRAAGGDGPCQRRAGQRRDGRDQRGHRTTSRCWFCRAARRSPNAGGMGSRATPIQYGQEMYDQTSLVRDVVKYNYEMRYPEQGGHDRRPRRCHCRQRAARPRLSQPAARTAVARYRCRQRFPSAAIPAAVAERSPTRGAIARRWRAGWRKRKRPVILCQRGDAGRRAWRSVLSGFGQPPRHRRRRAVQHAQRAWRSRDPDVPGLRSEGRVAGRGCGDRARQRHPLDRS